MTIILYYWDDVDDNILVKFNLEFEFVSDFVVLDVIFDGVIMVGFLSPIDVVVVVIFILRFFISYSNIINTRTDYFIFC